MVQPIDYLGALPQVDLGQSLLGGLKTGVAIRGAIDARAEREKAAAQQAQAETDLRDYFAAPDPRKAAELTVKYPQLRESFKQSQELISKEQQDAEFGTGMRVYSALHQKRPEFALKILDENITAMKNSGQDTADLESIRSNIERDPDSAIGPVGLVLAGINPEGFDKAVSSFATVQKQPAEQAKLEAETFRTREEALATPERLDLERQQKRADIRNTESLIRDRSARLGYDQDKLQSDYELKMFELGQKQGTLDDNSKKVVNDATTNAVLADQSSMRLDDLASRIEQEGGGWGVASNAGEWLKKVGGFQNGRSDLINEYTRIRNSEAIKSLPPGVATDRDIELALKGIPPESADSASMVNFLRGAAKLNRIAAASDNAKAEWVAEVGFLGKPKRDIVIDGVNVPAGTTYSEFIKGYLTDKVKQRGAEQAQQNLPNRSYMKYANPGAQ